MGRFGMGAAISSPRSGSVIFRDQRLFAAQQPEQENDRLGSLRRLIVGGWQDGEEDADGRPTALAGRPEVEQAADFAAVAARSVFVPGMGERTWKTGQVSHSLMKCPIPAVSVHMVPAIVKQVQRVQVGGGPVTLDDDVPAQCLLREVVHISPRSFASAIFSGGMASSIASPISSSSSCDRCEKSE